jgi:hypothetical protein
MHEHDLFSYYLEEKPKYQHLILLIHLDCAKNNVFN